MAGGGGGGGCGGGSESGEAEVGLGGGGGVVNPLFWWFGFLVHVWLGKMVFENHVGGVGVERMRLYTMGWTEDHTPKLGWLECG